MKTFPFRVLVNMRLKRSAACRLVLGRLGRQCLSQRAGRYWYRLRCRQRQYESFPIREKRHVVIISGYFR